MVRNEIWLGRSSRRLVIHDVLLDRLGLDLKAEEKRDPG